MLEMRNNKALIVAFDCLWTLLDRLGAGVKSPRLDSLHHPPDIFDIIDVPITHDPAVPPPPSAGLRWEAG